MKTGWAPVLFLVSAGLAGAEATGGPSQQADINADDVRRILCDSPRRIPGRPARPLPCVETESKDVVLPEVSNSTMVSRWDVVQHAGVTPDLRKPWMGHNPLKGDVPVRGDDQFINVLLTSRTSVSPERNAFSRATSIEQRLTTRLSVYQGQTVWKPPAWELRLAPVFHLTHREGRQAAHNVRTDAHVTLSTAFYDRELRVVSDRYDFDRVRIGVQPFTTDPRGLLLQGPLAGIRWYGNRDNNRWQYNLGVFGQFEHDANTGLIDIDDGLRGNVLAVANLYRQDFVLPGLTSELVWLHDRHERVPHRLDSSGRQERPVPLFDDQEAGSYRVTYLAWGLDGHIGRLNVTSLIALTRGEVSVAGGAGESDVGEAQSVRGTFAATEFSLNQDWWRPRLTLLHASGDDHPDDGRATGFDAVSSGALLSAMTHSVWRRLSISYEGVALSGRNNLLPTRQNNALSTFINPGLRLLGIGVDSDISPKLTASLNLNNLHFDQTGALLLPEGPDETIAIDKKIGTDISLAMTYRPHFNQQFLLSGAVGMLRAGMGLRQLMEPGGENPVYASIQLTVRY